jgi:hypothetical protein
MTERKIRRNGYVDALAKRLEEVGDEFMQVWRRRARRRDRVGDVSYRGMEVVHGGLELTIRSLNRLERATQPPHRAARHEPLPPETEAPSTRPHRPATPAAHRRRPEASGS